VARELVGVGQKLAARLAQTDWPLLPPALPLRSPSPPPPHLSRPLPPHPQEGRPCRALSPHPSLSEGGARTEASNRCAAGDEWGWE